MKVKEDFTVKKSNIEYYKKAVRLAEYASGAISKARADYSHGCEVAKGAYEGDLLGEKGYQDRLKELEAERDAQIGGALSQILTVVDEYDSEMEELGKLDGNMVDSGTMALLNSGINLSHADYQELANRHKDNAVMTRILRERYDANRPQEEGTGITIVRFGQSPADRSETFSKFVRTVYHACESGACPAISGNGKLKTPKDYYNYLAQSSLADMQPYGDENFDSLDADFPVETVNGKVENAGRRSSSFNNADVGFDFGFTPIR